MAFHSILFYEEEPALEKKMPEFFHDLQLDYLLDIIKSESKSYAIEPLYYTLPKKASTVTYRQEVYQDFMQESLRKAVADFCLLMQKSRRACELSGQCEDTVSAASYHVEAATKYWQALLVLEKAYMDCEIKSEGMKAFGEFLAIYLKERRENGWERDIERAETFFSDLTFSLIMEEDKITIVEESSQQPDFSLDIIKCLGGTQTDKDWEMPDLFPNQLELSPLESTLVRLLSRSQPKLFGDIEEFYHRNQDFYSDCILQFEQEIQFYLSFYKFCQRTKKYGYELCMPELSENREFSGQGLFDLALAWRNSVRGDRVVDNDFEYPQKASFFVVTGPNQGGKTTFARSMGQAVYFSMMGLPANVKRFQFPFFQGIVTHFEAEEEIQSNSGKLKEEINRLAPIVQQDQRHIFVILNELFTTATIYDATIMGKKIMEYFLDRDSYGIYVTHIQELAEEREGILSLVAQVQPGEERTRTYRILPMEAQGYGYSDSLVKQFELGYEDIKRRLS